MKVLLVLALALFTGCNANIMRHRQPSKQQVDMMKDAFWDYVAKANMAVEDSLRQIRGSALGRDMNTLITESTDAINKFTDSLRIQVGPLTQDLMSKFSQESERLKARLEKDLTAVGTQLQPYAEDALIEMRRRVEELKRDAAPYSSSMDPEALRAMVMQKSRELRVQLDKNIEELQAQMVPYTEQLQEKVEQSMEEFQRSMAPLAQSFETQLTQKTREIQRSLAEQGEELRAKLDADAQVLKRQLTDLWNSFMKFTQ